MDFPWAPLYSIERSGKTEVTVSGLISIVAGSGEKILACGDTNYELWTRSCLKPWQLLAHLPALKANYPKLEDRHLALMLSSHSGEALHIKLLEGISAIGGIETTHLQCPDAYPMTAADRLHLQEAGMKKNSCYNNCSGKHMGYLLAMKAKQLPFNDYLNPQGIQFEPLRQLLAFLLNRTDSNFPTTTDGCRIPNYAFSVLDLSKLYVRLVQDFAPGEIAKAPEQLQPMLRVWPELRGYMSQFPEVVGGSKRIDTRIMQGDLTPGKNLTLLAKQGADGLMAISVSPTEDYPNGLGIVIKIASGTDMHHMEILINEVFRQLGLRAAEKIDPKDSHLKNNFHFSAKALTCKTSN